MKYSAYKNRKETDFFSYAGTEAKYDESLSRMAEDTAKAQFYDPALWALFVTQFRIGNVDDTDKGWRGEYWGKMMRGACFTYNYTKDPELYSVIESSVRDLIGSADGYGRISTYSRDAEFDGWDIWCRKYVMLGLEYFLEICRDDGLSDRIVRTLCAQADYIVSKIGPESEIKKPINTASCHWGGLNSSSILEPFVRLYNICGEKKYLDFAEYIISEGGMQGFDIFKAAYEGVLYPYMYPQTKAYEMISCFEGLIEYYRVTKKQEYLVSAENFARLVMDSDITVIGSAGTTHELFDHSKAHQFDPRFNNTAHYNGIMQETCVTVTWMKFCLQLLCLTGKAIYAEQIERSAYNALLGAVNSKRNAVSGQIFEFDSYSPLLCGTRGRAVGGHKDIVKGRFYWGCCVAIAGAGTAIPPLSAVMHARDGVAVSLYLCGRAQCGDVGIEISTDYPKGAEAKLRINLTAPKTFALYLRIPSSGDTAVTVCGKICDAPRGGYLRAEREWKDGDEVSITFDMRTEIIRARDVYPEADELSAPHFALKRGPVMLARDSQFGEDISAPCEPCEKDGYAVLSEYENKAFDSLQSYALASDCGEIHVCDYASCGKSWDPGMPVSVWINSKKV